MNIKDIVETNYPVDETKFKDLINRIINILSIEIGRYKYLNSEEGKILLCRIINEQSYLDWDDSMNYVNKIRDDIYKYIEIDNTERFDQNSLTKNENALFDVKIDFDDAKRYCDLDRSIYK